jgi:acyl dehydratase
MEGKEINFDDLTVGSEMPRLEKPPVTHKQLVRYSGASGDFNPIHTDPDAGKAAGTGLIAHGMLIMGFVGQAITDWLPKKYLRKFSARFVGTARPGDVVTVTGKVKGKDNAPSQRVLCEVTAKNQKGEVLVKGMFEAEFPVENDVVSGILF